MDSLSMALGQMREVFQRELDRVLQKVEELSKDMALYKCDVAAKEARRHVKTKKVEVPKPQNYSGAHDAFEVENFLWGLKQYFDVAGMTNDADNVRNTSLYLTNTIMLW